MAQFTGQGNISTRSKPRNFMKIHTNSVKTKMMGTYGGKSISLKTTRAQLFKLTTFSHQIFMRIVLEILSFLLKRVRCFCGAKAPQFFSKKYHCIGFLSTVRLKEFSTKRLHKANNALNNQAQFFHKWLIYISILTN